MGQQPVQVTKHPGQILSVILRLNFLSTPKSKWAETNTIGSLMFLSFHTYVDHQIWSPFVAWATSLVNAGSGIRDIVKVELDLDSFFV
jgi:hypothetical protein